MCGIAGVFLHHQLQDSIQQTLERMIFPLIHRGPDGYGFFHDQTAGLAHARLSIIDLEGGWQPIHNEDKTLWVIFNGEIFNYKELREQLLTKGHRFYTQSDTEVIVHLYEDEGPDCLHQLNGQFAIAIYDSKAQSLFLGRDRMGIRPLFYTVHNGIFSFASEIKSILASDKNIPRTINPKTLSEIFTFWMPGGSDTIFEGIEQLPAGHWLQVNSKGKVQKKEYWDIPFHCRLSESSEKLLCEQLREKLIHAVQLRLRADVPVGAYLSGGLDSSTITSLIHHYTDTPLKTFSVTFTDHVYDESTEQELMVNYLGTNHHTVSCDYSRMAQSFPDVIWHTETPILRTAPTPLFLLSSLVRQHNYKVVLTGEGADEILGGYDIFKEAKIRAFIHRNPSSALRPVLLRRLYPYLALSPSKSSEFARKFFDTDTDPITTLFYAHEPRWKTTAGTKLFFSDALRDSIKGTAHLEELESRFSSKLKGLDYFSRAQYLECKLLLGNYLLSSQGDRMGMAHSVEGRFPFLDHHVVEFACSIPPHLRMKVLNEKNILKKSVVDILPPEITRRKKQPYMAPDILSFFGEKSPEYLDYYLSEQMLNEAGFFKPAAVRQLVKKCSKGARQGFRENMAFVGILSTQILYEKYILNFQLKIPEKISNIRILS